RGEESSKSETCTSGQLSVTNRKATAMGDTAIFTHHSSPITRYFLLVDTHLRLEALVLLRQRKVNLLVEVDFQFGHFRRIRYIALAVDERMNEPVRVVAFFVVLAAVTAPALFARQGAQRRAFRKVEQATEFPRFDQ